MVNLFGYRSTDPAALRGVRDPIGELNDFWLRRAVLESDVAIAAWGAGGSLLSRAQQITERFGSRLQVLGYTKDGAPRHPLYLRKTSLPQPMLINSWCGVWRCFLISISKPSHGWQQSGPRAPQLNASEVFLLTVAARRNTCGSPSRRRCEDAFVFTAVIGREQLSIQ